MITFRDLLEHAAARVDIANREGNPILTAWLVDARAALAARPNASVAGLLAAALVDAGMTGTAAEATAAQLLADFHIAPRGVGS